MVNNSSPRRPIVWTVANPLREALYDPPHIPSLLEHEPYFRSHRCEAQTSRDLLVEVRFRRFPRCEVLGNDQQHLLSAHLCLERLGPLGRRAARHMLRILEHNTTLDCPSKYSPSAWLESLT